MEKKKIMDALELEQAAYEAAKKENNVELKTHLLIDNAYSGTLELLEEGKSVVQLTTTEEMGVDKMGLVHGGFIFSAADFAAMACVNEKNVVLAASKCEFLAPVKVGSVVVFTALVRQKDSRKRIVKVEGKLGNVKIFSGDFKAVITDRHVLQLDLVKSTEA